MGADKPEGKPPQASDSADSTGRIEVVDLEEVAPDATAASRELRGEDEPETT